MHDDETRPDTPMDTTRVPAAPFGLQGWSGGLLVTKRKTHFYSFTWLFRLPLEFVDWYGSVFSFPYAIMITPFSLLVCTIPMLILIALLPTMVIMGRFPVAASW